MVKPCIGDIGLPTLALQQLTVRAVKRCACDFALRINHGGDATDLVLGIEK
jgi:hypothetical protein